MNYQSELEEYRQALISQEIILAEQLRDRALHLFTQVQLGTETLESLMPQTKELISEFEQFESTTSNFLLLNFLYAIIARLHLHTHDVANTLTYALAGVDANEKCNDVDGIVTNKQVIVDCCAMFGAGSVAVKIIKDTPQLDQNLISLFDSLPTVSDNVAKMEKLILTKVRPQSLKFILDDGKGEKERVVRTLMKTLKCSRNHALSQIKSFKTL
ncbi:hypothetical protein [Photobacterium leiognathi]|uniref:hypothetical protein n=1 Tax=Photobacterium leiognathi TaxID=553611 RepID=UPI00298280F7|nr:hypothetical protein [Photobacterium leiognathi]